MAIAAGRYYLVAMSVQLREMRRRLDAAKASSIEFCQPSVVTVPPNGPGWLHEIKHDGFRLAVRRDAGGIRLITRNGHDWSSRYPSIVSAANALRCKSCVIDGEVVVCWRKRAGRLQPVAVRPAGEAGSVPLCVRSAGVERPGHEAQAD